MHFRLARWHSVHARHNFPFGMVDKTYIWLGVLVLRIFGEDVVGELKIITIHLNSRQMDLLQLVNGFN